MRKIAAFVIVLATLVLGSASASAAVVTVGSPLTAEFFPGGFGNFPITFTNVVTAEPNAHLNSPITGRIIRWHVLKAEGGPFYLRVLRPNGSHWVGAGTSEPQTPTNTGLQTFNTSLPIQAGDAIGLEARGPNSSTVGFTIVPGFEGYYWTPAVAEGASSPEPTKLGEIAAFNAEVQPPPSLSAISPSTGSVTGGTAVAISGTDLENATAVKFGGTPATSFTVDSESKITAIAPAATSVGEVDVSVTTLAGTTSLGTASKFKYEACKVPKLKGKKLKAAKSSLKAAKCALGKVTRKGKGPGKNAKVAKQSVKPGKLLAPGSKVNITLRSQAAKKG
jgi:hypothetical protein